MSLAPDAMPDAPRALKRLLSKPLTAKRAARMIAGFTLLTTLAGGALAWLIDRSDFPTFGRGLWWALQTVTTVGYGDIVPKKTEGKVIAAVVMLAGIAFLAVITAAVTATLVENARRRFNRADAGDTEKQLEQIDARLTAIEAAIKSSSDARG